jgi:class 3 adenylate cyclase
MASTTTRKNDTILRFISALALTGVTWAALRAMPFYPPWLEIALSLGTGALAVLSPATASILFVCVLALPVVAADFVVGVAFLTLGLVATQYLSVGRAGGFLLAAIGVAAIPLHAEWAVAAVAGYLLGRGRGSLAAVTVCLLAVAAGIALGTPVLGSIATGGTAPGILAFTDAPAGALGFGWLIPGVKAADPMTLLDAVLAIEKPLLVGLQAMLWALSAVVGAAFRSHRSKVLALAGTAAAALLLAVGSFGLDAVFAGPLGTGTFLATLAVSLPLAVVVTALAAWVFPLKPAARAATAPVAAMDVDDLLRTIASAEDELAARHNTEAVVMITDMKSFSAMTEELGSVESAKIVQRHRDLLLPIIRQHRGQGTPTGGDGLVAAFRSPGDATAAAVAMQQVLEGYTGSDRSPHELAVRIGIASGEVVLDAAGCPFLGTALNLAARVMDLADGGRVMTTGAVADGSGLPAEALHVHGNFKLKNIAEAVPVVEILWREGTPPQDIRAS